MVKHLLECGANLLIVNRNGKTPCGLASCKDYLTPETCAFLEKIKSEQLQAGGTYHHYNIDANITSSGTSPSEHNEHYATSAIAEQSSSTPTKTTEQLEQETRKILFGETENHTPSLKSLSKMLRDAGRYLLLVLIVGQHACRNVFLTLHTLVSQPERKVNVTLFVL